MSYSVIGILALQGAFGRHKIAVDALGYNSRLVRNPADLAGLGGLIIPGGESTVIGKLLVASGLHSAIKGSAADGLPIFGTCAGLILLAKEVKGPVVTGLELLDVSVERNGYGRQRDSFKTELIWRDGEIEGVFIRAPRITRTGAEVKVECRKDGEAVLVRQASVLASAFHPELTGNLELHRYFIEEVCG